MNLKEFLKELDDYTKYFSPEALKFYCELVDKENEVKITEKGLAILKGMQDNFDSYMNIFSAKHLGEILSIPPRSVSGSIKKLIADGYVSKTGTSPIVYSLTDLGKNFSIDEK